MLQNYSAHVPENVITELKDNEHNKPSMIEKGTSYFNIFKCGRNLLDQIDGTYQRAFMASLVQEEYYTSPAQERYYKQLTKILINSNVGSDGSINNDKLNQKIIDLKAEAEAGNERNINDMTQVDEYKSPGKIKMHQRSAIRHIIIRMSTKMK